MSETKFLQLSMHDTVNAKISHLNKAQVGVLIRELQDRERDL